MSLTDRRGDRPRLLRCRPHRLVAVAALGLALSLSGCSQVEQLRPVAGDELTAVSFATKDVLVQQGVDILVAPVCTFEQPQYVCVGSTIEGEEIKSTVEDGEDATLIITVGGLQVFTGTVDEVLREAGQAS